MAENLDEEMEQAKQAAEALIKHMRRMSASNSEWALLDETGLWVLSVRHTSVTRDDDA